MNYNMLTGACCIVSSGYTLFFAGSAIESIQKAYQTDNPKEKNSHSYQTLAQIFGTAICGLVAWKTKEPVYSLLQKVFEFTTT